MKPLMAARVRKVLAMGVHVRLSVFAGQNGLMRGVNLRAKKTASQRWRFVSYFLTQNLTQNL